jgi:hypothetical protein
MNALSSKRNGSFVSSKMQDFNAGAPSVSSFLDEDLFQSPIDEPSNNVTALIGDDGDD